MVGPDGLTYSPDRNRELDDLCASVLSRGMGRELLAYLRSITIELVGGPEITDAQLRHREGARYLVAVLETRMKSSLQRKGKRNAGK